MVAYSLTINIENLRFYIFYRLKKLYQIHCRNNCGKLRNVFSLPNLERSYKERQYCTLDLGRNQGSLTKTDKKLNCCLLKMKFDVDSSVLLMIETLSERMLNNHMEVLPSISKLVEFCVTRDKLLLDKLENLFFNINFTRETVSIHDTLSYQVCIVKIILIKNVLNFKIKFTAHCVLSFKMPILCRSRSRTVIKYVTDC